MFAQLYDVLSSRKSQEDLVDGLKAEMNYQSMLKGGFSMIASSASKHRPLL